MRGSYTYLWGGTTTAGIWHDRGRTGAGNVLSIREGAIRDKVRRVRNCGEECRDEDRGPRHRRLVAS